MTENRQLKTKLLNQIDALLSSMRDLERRSDDYNFCKLCCETSDRLTEIATRLDLQLSTNREESVVVNHVAYEPPFFTTISFELAHLHETNWCVENVETEKPVIAEFNTLSEAQAYITAVTDLIRDRRISVLQYTDPMQKPFPIGSITREVLLSCLPREKVDKLSDDDMRIIADEMADAHINGHFYTDLDESVQDVIEKQYTRTTCKD